VTASLSEVTTAVPRAAPCNPSCGTDEQQPEHGVRPPHAQGLSLARNHRYCVVKPRPLAHEVRSLSPFPRPMCSMAQSKACRRLGRWHGYQGQTSLGLQVGEPVRSQHASCGESQRSPGQHASPGPSQAVHVDGVPVQLSSSPQTSRVPGSQQA
jgi:hypothetical protein